MRKTLVYLDEAEASDKNCATCAQYTQFEPTTDDCGGCKLFSGPVRANGGCLAYAPAYPRW